MFSFSRLFLCLFLFCAKFLFAQNKSRYFVEFKDKKSSRYSLAKPQNFLSAKALQRREIQKVSLDSTDLPISEIYLKNLLPFIQKPLGSSKWLNGVLVVLSSKSELVQIQTSIGVKAIHYLGANPQHQTTDSTGYFYQRYLDESFSKETRDSNLYGLSLKQITQLKEDKLHQKGLTGKGMTVAVLDAGFKNVNKLKAFTHLYARGLVRGSRDLLAADTNVYDDDDHGTHVFSCLAAADSGFMMGSAPDATYWLIRTEDAANESPAEEIYWAMGAELADSLGVDVISASLGYTTFDETELNHSPEQLNGHTTWAARAASMAVKKGILVCVSNGNEGNGTWQYCGTPADADGVVNIGAVDRDGYIAPFSSIGFGKSGPNPDLVAMGEGTLTATAEGTYRKGNGTSYAAPLLCGAIVSLKSGYPKLGNDSLINIVKKASNHYAFPCEKYGSGIPDMNAAWMMATGLKDTLIALEYDETLKGITLIFHSSVAGEFDFKFYKKGETQSMDKTPMKAGYNHFFIEDTKGEGHGIYEAKIDFGEKKWTGKLEFWEW